MTPAIYFDSDAYALDGPKLMGRQSAGNGFLRAAVRAHAGRTIHGVSISRPTGELFRDLVLRLDPQAQPMWIPAHRLDGIARQGLLFRPDINIVVHARERLRVGADAYSLCGVTHTLCSQGPADALADMIAGPVMPWDAVICTSTVARDFVEGLLTAQEDYLAWRFGQTLATRRPQLPVIPLGVHAADFEVDDAGRAAARAALGLAEDEVAALFAGRMMINGKAHPYQTYLGLERATRATGRKLALIHAGQFPTPELREAFHAAAAAWAPSVRAVFVDGADARAFASTWRAADLFISLADSIQETFGLTPLEAMAAGLPVIVSDWNGYKDTVRDGEVGFRIPTWAPGPGTGADIARDFEVGATDYEYFLSRTSTTVSVDPGVLVERLVALIESPDLRRSLGAAGRAHVRRGFDWAAVYARYEALWRELAEIRADAGPRLAAAPRESPTRRDPFASFATYPTRHIGPRTRVAAAAGADLAAYQALTANPMHSFWVVAPERIERTLAASAGEGVSVADLAAALGEPAATVVERVSRLAKLELVHLRPSEPETGETET